MKTLRRIVAGGLLIGSYHVGFAQSNGGSPSSAQLEKKANKEAYQAELKQKAAAADAAKEAKAGSTAASPAQKQEWKGQKHAGLNNAQTVKNSEKYSSDAEKKAAVSATAPKAPANAQRINTTSKKTVVAPVRAANANVAAKRLPANYDDADKRTSKSDQ